MAANVRRRKTINKRQMMTSARKGARDTRLKSSGKPQQRRRSANSFKVGDMTITPANRDGKLSWRTLILKDVYDVTPERYKGRSKFAEIPNFDPRLQIVSEEPRKARRVILSECYTTHDSKGNPKKEAELHYQIIIGWLDSENRTLWNQPCRVSCSCKDFLFTDEVALYKRGNADVRFSNGADPVIKNPSERPQVCKHLIAVMKKIRQRRL